MIRTTLSLSAVLTAAALAHVLVMAGTAAPSSEPVQASSTTLCHKPGTPAQQTVQVEDSAVAGHLGHGDTMGACGPTPTTTPPTSPPSTAPPSTAPAPPTTAPPRSTVPLPTTTPTSPSPSIPAPGTEEVVVAGASTIRTESSEIRRARVAGEGVRLAGTAPDGCRPVLRVDGALVARVPVGPAGAFDVAVATDELAAGRHVAEVVCSGGPDGVLVRKTFWIAAPLTGSDVLSVGMLSVLTLGAVGWVGIRTLRDTTIGAGGTDPSASGAHSSV